MLRPTTTWALLSQGKLKKIPYFESVLLKPDYAETYNNMGVTLEEQGKLEEA